MKQRMVTFYKVTNEAGTFTGDCPKWADELRANGAQVTATRVRVLAESGQHLDACGACIIGSH